MHNKCNSLFTTDVMFLFALVVVMLLDSVVGAANSFRVLGMMYSVQNKYFTCVREYTVVFKTPHRTLTHEGLFH